MTGIRATRDAYLGLDDATWEAWDTWHQAMLHERAAVRTRARIDGALYADASTAWSDTCFRQLFLFAYDVSFYDRAARRYRTGELVKRWRAMFGRVDSALLWHAYPRLGFDARTQYDFYREMPGGLAQLRAEVSDVLHAEGIRLFLDYNPWDAGGADELAEIVVSLDADGVMLDTMSEVSREVARAVRARKPNVVFAPELRPRDEELSNARQSWAQWFEVDPATPSILRHRWIEPRHRQLSIRRWDTSRKDEIGYAFFNGSGQILWDNVFGTWNPYAREDRRLLAETGAIFDSYGELFAHGDWRPLVPSGAPGLDANVWRRGAREIVTLRNRSKHPLAYRVDRDGFLAFWGREHALRAGAAVVVEAEGVQALVYDDAERARDALAHFEELSARADVDMPDYEARTPRPMPVPASLDARGDGTPTPRSTMVAVPGGDFEMRVVHERRECGCLPYGAPDDVTWGWFYKDVVTHAIRIAMPSFAMRKTAVTNGEFLRFVHRASYRPRDTENFLRHLARRGDGSLPDSLSHEQSSLPVTYVSLDDARAYAAWRGERLPTEAEWQWAAEGAGRGHRFSWGNEERSFAHELRPALDATTATPQGVYGLTGNAWELTESEHFDGHTRCVMLRGGVYLPPGASEWLVPRGPRPNDFHAKYIMLADGLDRSETVSFRTVADA
jgi:formylglycine-generating enzyme required for sulfatase activity